MDRNDFPAPETGFVITQFLTVSDVKVSTEWYATILDGKVVMEGEPTIIKVANTWLIINVGGGPTADKPEHTLEAPNPDSKVVNSFLNIRVADINQTVADWKAKGATFLTDPVDFPREYRCYMQDPDGYIIEVGQSKI